MLTRENRKHGWNNLFFFRRDEKRHFDILFWCNTKTLVGCANRMLRKPNSYSWNGVERHSRSRNNTRTIFDLVCKLNWLFIVIFSFLTTPAIKLHTNPYIFCHYNCLMLSAWELGFPLQPRNLVRGTVILFGKKLRTHATKCMVWTSSSLFPKLVKNVDISSMLRHGLKLIKRENVKTN